MWTSLMLFQSCMAFIEDFHSERYKVTINFIFKAETSFQTLLIWLHKNNMLISSLSDEVNLAQVTCSGRFQSMGTMMNTSLLHVGRWAVNLQSSLICHSRYHLTSLQREESLASLSGPGIPDPVNLPTHSKYWLKNNDCFPTISAVFPALPFLISSHRVILSGLRAYILKCAASCRVLKSCSESFQMSFRPHSQ